MLYKVVKYIIFVMGLVGSNYPMKAEAITVAHSFLSQSINNRNMNQDEVFKDIKYYECIYQVSNLGNVMSLDRIVGNEACGFRKLTGKVVKIRINSAGYYIVGLTKYGKQKTFSIHRLVATSFVPNPDNKPHVNHIDGNKLNNHYTNVEWCTHKENMIHAFATGLAKPSNKARLNNRGANNISSIKVVEIDINNNVINEYESMGEASRIVGVSQASVSLQCNGKYKKGKHMWRYKDKYYENISK